MYFMYGEEETNFLKEKDDRMAAVIDRVGHVYRETDDNLFSAVVHQIIGQQISSKAQTTVWERLKNTLGVIDAETVARADETLLCSAGMSPRKAGHIVEFAKKVSSGAFDPDAISAMSDERALDELTSLSGVGRWTAEMILLFCLQRRDVFAVDDLGLRRGVRMLYRPESMDRKLMEKYKEFFSPYGSIASLYLWEVAGCRVPGYAE